LPQNRKHFERKRYHIPLLFVGAALNPKLLSTQNTHTISQTDIAPTLLENMGYAAKEFRFGSNIMTKSPVQNFALASYDNGFLWITPHNTVAYDNNYKQVIYNENATDTAAQLRAGKAYLQKIEQAFLE
jgi:membrane-anchored protein YejM (alkaline phosphatase superfamily)